MGSRCPMQSSEPVRAPKSINSLPPELLCMIAQYLTVEPDVTTKDQTVQRRQNLYPLCLVSQKLCPIAARFLYETVHIAGTNQLKLFFNTVESQPQLGQLVRKLFVNLGICWPRSAVPSWVICGQLYKVLKTTMRLQWLSLDLQECTGRECIQVSGPEDFAPGGSNGTDPYEGFYERVEAEHGTFLPILNKLYFTSNGIPYTYCALFALPSLRCIVSMRDTGAWPMILDSGYDIGTQNPHIKKLSLRNSALIPSEADVIPRSFPMLEEFEFSTNAPEMNRQVFSDGLTVVNPDRQNLSATLARMTHLRSLALGLHFRRAPGLVRINFPMHLGPAGGITSLGGLRNLAYLQIGMHLLMCYRGENSQTQAQPLPPSVLPPNLERLRLSTCLSCWDNQIASLSRNSGDQTLPSHAGDSTLKFVKSLATHVRSGTRLGGLRDVRIYSQTSWWLAYGADYRTVKHCKEEQGQIWNAGGFQECCGISRLETRTPGIHFRAYETNEYGCGQHQPYQPDYHS